MVAELEWLIFVVYPQTATGRIMNGLLGKQVSYFILLAICLLPFRAVAQAPSVEDQSVREYPPAEPPVPLSDTAPLNWDGDIARRLVEGAHLFLDRQTAATRQQRQTQWKSNLGNADFAAFLSTKRETIRSQLGLHVELTPTPRYEVVSELTLQSASGVTSENGEPALRCSHVRWPFLSDPGPRNLTIAYADGILLEPEEAKNAPLVIALTDSSLRCEEICGLKPATRPEYQFANRLAASGCRVLVPVLVSRETQVHRGFHPTAGPGLNSREFTYRSAFELGQHLIGYEVRIVESAITTFASTRNDSGASLIGYGEGARLALYTAALNSHFNAVCISAGLGSVSDWSTTPIDRNIYGVLPQAEDAELAYLANQHADLIIDDSNYKPIQIKGPLSAPAEVSRPQTTESTLAELSQLLAQQPTSKSMEVTGPHELATVSDHALRQFLGLVLPNASLNSAVALSGIDEDISVSKDGAQRLVQQLDLFHQLLLAESSFSRKELHQLESFRSLDQLQQYHGRMRPFFSESVIGHFPDPRLPFNSRTRKRWESQHWTAYEVVLDVYEDLFAYGVLIVPKGIAPHERRPVVVCQHGLEGRPTDTFLGDHRAYRDFAAQLAERGFITFAPQNLYIFRDDFRGLQRKANPLGKTLFSMMVPQHQQIVDWLQSLPSVDPERIAFYGLSYGGKSAMRIPALVEDYCLSICSADFNEWVLKNASSRHPFSYVWTGEYEIFEFNLAHTFNYAEMAALIAPRPFMVERGHHDGVGWDEWVAFEYAKIRRLYAQLEIPDRTEIEFFNDGHTIHGMGTFQFLHKHLNWSAPDQP